MSSVHAEHGIPSQSHSNDQTKFEQLRHLAGGVCAFEREEEPQLREHIDLLRKVCQSESSETTLAYSTRKIAYAFLEGHGRRGAFKHNYSKRDQGITVNATVIAANAVTCDVDQAPALYAKELCSRDENLYTTDELPVLHLALSMCTRLDEWKPSSWDLVDAMISDIAITESQNTIARLTYLSDCILLEGMAGNSLWDYAADCMALCALTLALQTLGIRDAYENMLRTYERQDKDVHRQCMELVSALSQ